VLLLAWIPLGLAIALRDGAYSGKVLLLAVAAFVLLAAVVLTGATGIRDRWLPGLVSGSDATLASALGAALGASLAAAIVFDAGLYAGSGRLIHLARALAAATAAAALASGLLRPSWRRWAWALAVLGSVGAGSLLIRASPAPRIDVWFILTQATGQLRHGHNLYTACWSANPNPRTVCVYPYGPLTTVLQLPFRALFGDVRYAYLAAGALAAALVYRIAPPPWRAGLAALVLVTPKFLFGLEQAWTEPLLLAGLCLLVWGVLLGRPAWAVVGLAVALACKQHMLLLVPLAAWWPAFGVRRTLTSLLAAGAATLPWVLLDPHAFVSDSVLFHVRQVPDPRSLSLYSLALEHGWTPPFPLVAGVTALAIGLVLWRVPRTATGFVVGAAFVLFAFDLVNKQSFYNEYSLVVGLLVLGAAVAVRERAPDTARHSDTTAAATTSTLRSARTSVGATRPASRSS